MRQGQPPGVRQGPPPGVRQGPPPGVRQGPPPGVRQGQPPGVRQGQLRLALRVLRVQQPLQLLRRAKGRQQEGRGALLGRQ